MTELGLMGGVMGKGRSVSELLWLKAPDCMAMTSSVEAFRFTEPCDRATLKSVVQRSLRSLSVSARRPSESNR
eukprot:CAMPEP_0181532244 /NCGR_PEP_ID=MMETSP1110-20121109/72513_1 /TAXON_ID=174948 /ORGANISM="Symbiodinium sp., Strain CCMP421" /LENGTH=72 /DNA_ID=CAMNT_0023663333 /DNA_START=237 /DNA_END=452 /DNA_ORIENTATION=+